jgi:alpha-glucosidase
MIYYGDEIGLRGLRDPDSRRAMVWDASQWNHDLLATTQRYIALRKKYVALRRRGVYAHLYAGGQVYAFGRQRDKQTVIIALNAGPTAANLSLAVQQLLPNGATVRDEWSDAQLTVNDGHVQIQVPPRDGVVWVAE